MKNKKVYILSINLHKGVNSDVLADYFMMGHLKQLQLKGVVKGVGIDHYGDVKEYISILEKSYVMGKQLRR